MRTTDQPPSDQTPGPNLRHQRAGEWRQIGAIGTAARVVVGMLLLGSVVQGEYRAGFVPAARALGLVGFPAVLLAWPWMRVRRTSARFQATGPVGFALNCLIFLAVYLTSICVPALAFTSDAALIFYGASMLLAALWGYAGCEVLALSNWVLHRDDQVGCIVFAPVDQLAYRESRHEREARSGFPVSPKSGEATYPSRAGGPRPRGIV